MDLYKIYSKKIEISTLNPAKKHILQTMFSHVASWEQTCDLGFVLIGKSQQSFK